MSRSGVWRAVFLTNGSDEPYDEASLGNNAKRQRRKNKGLHIGPRFPTVLILIPPSVGARFFSEQQSIYDLASHIASLQGGNIIYQSEDEADLAFLTAVISQCKLMNQ